MAMATETDTKEKLRRYINSSVGSMARESEDISLLLLKRNLELQKRLQSIKSREERAQEGIEQAEKRIAAVMEKRKPFVIQRYNKTEELQIKELKLQQSDERVEKIMRFTETCNADIEKMGKNESKVGELEKKMNDAVDKGYQVTQALIKASKIKDTMQRVLLDKEDSYRTVQQKEKEVEVQRDAMVKRQNELKQVFKGNIANATEAYHKCVQVAPRILIRQEEIKRYEKKLVLVEEISDVKEDQLRKVKRELGFLKDKLDLAKLELTVKKERKAKSDADEAARNRKPKPKQALVFRNKHCQHGYAQSLEECLRKTY